ncbi:MAG: hypothetical protein OXM56_04020, partial [Gammaproteobacteria bacterium]|nr:hypothetical protein [Gammaproteobacteria bacterium]
GENVQITAMLVGYPDVGPGQVASASAFTTVKGYIGPVYQILGIGLLLVASVRRIFNRTVAAAGDD